MSQKLLTHMGSNQVLFVASKVERDVAVIFVVEIRRFPHQILVPVRTCLVRETGNRREMLSLTTQCSWCENSGCTKKPPPYSGALRAAVLTDLPKLRNSSSLSSMSSGLTKHSQYNAKRAVICSVELTNTDTVPILVQI